MGSGALISSTCSNGALLAASQISTLSLLAHLLCEGCFHTQTALEGLLFSVRSAGFISTSVTVPETVAGEPGRIFVRLSGLLSSSAILPVSAFELEQSFFQ